MTSTPAPPDRGAEAFLAAFHDHRPGLTPKAFGALPVTVDGQVHSSSYHLLADALPPRLAGASVLDLACGDGFLLSLLQARAGPATRLVGIDLSAGELAHARVRLGAAGLLCRANALALPFPAANFDAVTCHLALMLIERTADALVEVHRVLRPGGTFAAVVGAPSPGSAVPAAYSEVLSRYPRAPRWQDVRFGDRRIRSAEGIRELMAPHFSAVTVRDAALERRLPPAGVWDWLLDMYDLYLLGETDRMSIRDDLLRALVPLTGPDGNVAFAQSLRVISATAA